MKTIAEIAEEIGVSRQAIHLKIKQEPLSSALQNFTSRNGKVIMFDDKGIDLIKSTFPKEKMSSTSQKMLDIHDKLIDTLQQQINSLNEQNTVLQNQLNVKDRQLENKDTQIEELTATIKLQAESINHDRKNELAETIIDGNVKLIESENKKEGNFLQRLLFKNKKNR